MSKKKVNKDTKAYKEKQVKKVRNRCLKLWKECVKLRAGNKCETPGCEEVERLNAHHIEVYLLNPYLRYEITNGMCFCPTHHKWGKASAHKSYLFMDKIHGYYPTRFRLLRETAEQIELNKVMPVQDLDYFETIEQKLIKIKETLINPCNQTTKSLLYP